MSPPFVVGDSSPFLKRVLIPFWVIRCIIMLIQIALYALVVAGLGVFKDDDERLWDEYHTHLSYDAVLAVSIIIMLIILFCLSLDIVCIIKRARRTLSPRFFLSVNITQSVFYVVNFILTMINAHNGILSICIGVVILLSFIGLLIYAAVVYHQFRTGKLQGSYAVASNPEVHNLVANTAYPGVAEPAIITTITAADTADITTYPQQSYTTHEYPKAAYYDQQAALEAQSYGGGGTGYAAPSAYEPYSHKSVEGHRSESRAHEQAQGLMQSPGQGQQTGQQRYEMTQRPA